MMSRSFNVFPLDGELTSPLNRIQRKRQTKARGDLSCQLDSSAPNRDTTKRSDRPCLANAGEDSLICFRSAIGEVLQAARPLVHEPAQIEATRSVRSGMLLNSTRRQ